MFQTFSDATVKKENIPQGETPGGTPRRRPVQLRIDVPMLLVSATLVIFGILMVYSASWDYSLAIYDSPSYIFSRQLLWLGLGLGVAVLLTFLDYHLWLKLAVPAILLTILLLIAVLFVSDIRHGAVRTLFGGSIQPSELAKLTTVVYLAVWLYAKRDDLSDIKLGLVPLAVILGILGGLIIVQPDLSAVITIFFLGGTLFFLAGGDLRQIGLLILIAALVGCVERIESYLAGLRDPTQASYHVRRSIEAFVKGGWFGVGIGNAQTKLTGLPVPPTDSIFAVVGEETGVFGAIALVGLYAIFLWRGLGIARRAPDVLGMLLAAGLSLWLAMEAFVNMAVMINLLPFAGNALPFISAGGSNLLVSFAAVGLLMNISRLSVDNQEENWRPFSAVVNLRRRNRRRSVSSPRRSANGRSRR
jgi:cell division protein FtsW